MDWPVGVARRLYPLPSAVGAVHGKVLLLDKEAHLQRPWIALNMVASVDGRVRMNGGAAGLGSSTDLHLLQRLRTEADGVMIGAATIRAERFAPEVPPEMADSRTARGVSPQPTGIVITASGDLPLDHPYFATASPQWPRLIYAGHARARELAREGIEVVIIPPHPLPPPLGGGDSFPLGARPPDPQGYDGERWAGPVGDGGGFDLGEVAKDLLRRGFARIVCEGGPTLNGSLLAAGAVDELFVTIAARLVGGADPLRLIEQVSPFHDVGHGLSEVRDLTLRSLYERDGELLVRHGLT